MRRNFASTGENAMIIGEPAPCPWATGSLQVAPSTDTCTMKPRGYGTGRGGSLGPGAGPPGFDAKYISASVAGSGSSSCHHMPGACGAIDDHPLVSSARSAFSRLWLADAFHDDCTRIITGTAAASSACVHGAV